MVGGSRGLGRRPLLLDALLKNPHFHYGSGQILDLGFHVAKRAAKRLGPCFSKKGGGGVATRRPSQVEAGGGGGVEVEVEDAGSGSVLEFASPIRNPKKAQGSQQGFEEEGCVGVKCPCLCKRARV